MPKKDEREIKDLVRKEQKKIAAELRTKNADMFKTAKQPSDIQVYLDNQLNLSADPKSLTTIKVGGLPLVKSVATIAKPIKDLTIIDLRLNVNGPFEDEIYASFPTLIKNIRRGNTVLRIDKESGAEYSLGRKGLEKFFDMRYEYISQE